MDLLYTDRCAEPLLNSVILSGLQGRNGPLATPNNPTGILLDTHVWLRYLGISGDLRKTTLPALHRAAAQGLLFISVISVWEIALLVRRNRLSLSKGLNQWVNEALAKPGINLL